MILPEHKHIVIIKEEYNQIPKQETKYIVIYNPVQDTIQVSSILYNLTYSQEYSTLNSVQTQKVHEIVIKECKVGKGGGSYTGVANLTVGGITSGQTFTNASMQEMWDFLLNPEQFPNLTNPSVNLISSVTGLREIGEVVTINLTANFSRGSISPQYTAESEFRSGLPNLYEYTGTDTIDIPSTDMSTSQSVVDYTVVAGVQTWRVRTSYDEGVQPFSSTGEIYDAPLPAGTTGFSSRSITGVLPYFATTSDIMVMTKQALTTASTINITLIQESTGNKQKVSIPQSWGVVTQIQQWNPITSNWDTIDLDLFTQTTEQREVQGTMYDYYLYTHNGSLVGTRDTRWFV